MDSSEGLELKVCVIGLGQVGLPTAKYCLNKGLDVYGYDLSERAVGRALAEGTRSSSSWEDVPSTDVYIICVSTSLEGKAPDLQPVQDACTKVAQRAKSKTPRLVSVESTVTPGTLRRIHREIFSDRVPLVHVPHRYWAGDPTRHGVRQLRVIGAVNGQSLQAGVDFYKNILDIPLHSVSSVEVAEMCKIAENAHRYVQIAFAEELAVICDEIGLNVEEVREACNSKWNTQVLEARDGIGGHCLPKDMMYLKSLSNHSILLRSALQVDKQYRRWRERARKGQG